MSRNILQYMDAIFEVLRDSIDNSYQDRIVETKRHIIADGNEDLISSIVRNAKIYFDSKARFNGLIVNYDSRYFLIIHAIYEECFRKIKSFTELNEIQTENGLEIIQACRMLAIAKQVISVKPSLQSLEIIDAVFGLGDDENTTYLFSDLCKFFEPSVVFEISVSSFPIEYTQDCSRLACIEAPEHGLHFLNTTSSESILEIIVDMALLLSSRGVADSLINAFTSSVAEYAYLQIYQCLEYLFSIDRTLYFSEKYNLDKDNLLDLISNINMFRTNEQQLLSDVISHYATQPVIENFLNTIEEQVNQNAVEQVSEIIYKIRCTIAHLKYNQSKYLEEINWEKHLVALSSLVLSIYSQCDAQLVSLLTNKEAWEKLSLSTQ